MDSMMYSICCLESSGNIGREIMQIVITLFREQRYAVAVVVVAVAEVVIKKPVANVPVETHITKQVLPLLPPIPPRQTPVLSPPRHRLFSQF